MPLLYIDVIEGRDPGEIKALLDTAHVAVVEAFDVPERDRYQVVKSHPAGEIVALDTGLGIDRSEQLVIIHLVSRRRTRAQKERLYALLAERLRDDCGLDPADLIVSVTENDDEDWSFGSGRAQFLTGELHWVFAANRHVRFARGWPRRFRNAETSGGAVRQSRALPLIVPHHSAIRHQADGQGVIRQSDVVKPGMRARFDELRALAARRARGASAQPGDGRARTCTQWSVR